MLKRLFPQQYIPSIQTFSRTGCLLHWKQQIWKKADVEGPPETNCNGQDLLHLLVVLLP